jgi:hypothetical protein
MNVLLRRNRSHRQAFGRFIQLDVHQLLARLRAQLPQLPEVDGASDAAAAARDAHARCATALAATAGADNGGAWVGVRRTVLEGLAAAAYVLDSDGDLPFDRHGPQLASRERVQVGDRWYDGEPGYDPQHPHRYPGGSVAGRAVPGGWYAVPFWDTLLLGGVLTHDPVVLP